LTDEHFIERAIKRAIENLILNRKRYAIKLLETPNVKQNKIIQICVENCVTGVSQAMRQKIFTLF
jgi:hypothetical protein